MSASGIVWAIAAWLALQIPIGMVVGQCIRRSYSVVTPRPAAKTRTRPFVGHTSALLRG